MEDIKYRWYIITYWMKPIPSRIHDYTFAHEDYDGAPDSGDQRCGTAASIEDAKADIDELIADENEREQETMVGLHDPRPRETI